MSTTSSKNFTTLYSGSGSVTPQGAYGNANVVSLLAAGTDGANTVTTISATGNITTDAYFVGNFAGNITGNISVPGSNTQVLYNNQGNVGTTAGFTFTNTTGELDVPGAITAVGNVTAPYFLGNGSQLTGLPATYGNANVAAFMAAYGANTISSTGNITTTANISGGYILGNGSQLTGLPANYGNANVAALLAAFGANTISSTGNITTTANVSGGYILGNGSQLTGLPATYGNANVVSLLAAFGSNTIVTTGNVDTGNLNATNAYVTGVVSASGNVRGGNVNTAGVVSAAGNVFGNNVNATNYVAFGTAGGVTTASPGQMFWDTAEQTVSLGMNNGVTQQIGLENYILVKASAAITDGQVVMWTGASGNNVEAAPANMSSAGFRPGYVLGIATQNIALNGTGYITAFGQVHGLNTNAYTAGDLLYLDPASTTGGLTATQPTAPNYIIQVGTVTKKSAGDGHIQVIIRINDKVNDLSDTTITSPTNGQVLTWTTGNVWVNANIGAANVTAAGANTQIQFNDSGVFAGNANLTYDKATNTFSTGIITATGNITGANVVASANLTSTQQTVVGTANVGATGNTVVSGRNIATDMAYSPDGATGNAQYTGRVMVGTGWNGNVAVGFPSRLSTMDLITRTNTTSQVRQFESDSLVSMTGNASSPLFRQQAIGGRVRVGGGSAANTVALSGGAGAPFAVSAGQFQVDIGNAAPYNLGNTAVSHATLNGGVLTLNPGSSVGNAYGFVSFSQAGGLGVCNVTNWMGYTSSVGSGNITNNMYCFYNGNATSLTSTGVQIANTARAATNYYFLRNDDEVAQVKLGSLRSYNEFQYATATSGTVNIDKNNAQVQFIAPTANVTIGDFQNFVTTANDSVNNDTQTDTVTLIIQQGATPYTVTMPTGNASIKYAGNTSVIGNTANSVTMVSVTAFRSSANTAIYLATVSPEFV